MAVRQRRDFAFELADELSQAVEPAALGAHIDDAEQRGAGLQLGADGDRGQAVDLALDRRAQRDQPRIDDRFGAGRLQQRPHRHPSGNDDHEDANQRLENAAVVRAQRFRDITLPVARGA